MNVDPKAITKLKKAVIKEACRVAILMVDGDLDRETVDKAAEETNHAEPCLAIVIFDWLNR